MSVSMGSESIVCIRVSEKRPVRYERSQYLAMFASEGVRDVPCEIMA